MLIYDHRAAIRALIHAAAGEKTEEQEEGKLQDTVCVGSHLDILGISNSLKIFCVAY